MPGGYMPSTTGCFGFTPCGRPSGIGSTFVVANGEVASSLGSACEAVWFCRHVTGMVQRRTAL